MSYRDLRDLRGSDVEALYLTALSYGQALWLKGHAGRAILAVTRALYADVSEDAGVLDDWPLPYAALQWIVANHRSDDFPGNPRISFQHQATRLRGDRQALHRTRAWAVWSLIVKARPSLEADLKQNIVEPSREEIAQMLVTYGHRNEPILWQRLTH